MNLLLDPRLLAKPGSATTSPDLRALQTALSSCPKRRNPNRHGSTFKQVPCARLLHCPLHILALRGKLFAHPICQWPPVAPHCFHCLPWTPLGQAPRVSPSPPPILPSSSLPLLSDTCLRRLRPPAPLTGCLPSSLPHRSFVRNYRRALNGI